MMTAFLEGPDLLVVLAIVVLLFGGSKLPQLARSLGQAKKELDAGMREAPAADQVSSAGSTSVHNPSEQTD